MPVRDALAMLVSAVMTVVGAVASAGGWLVDQIVASLGNWRDFFSDRDWFEDRARSWFTFAILAPLRYYGQLLKWAIAGSPREQIFAAAALAASLTIASAGILTVVALVAFVPLVVIGLLRMIPAVNQGYDGVANFGRSSTRWIPDRER